MMFPSAPLAATLVFSGREWIGIAGALFLGAVVALLWGYRKTGAARKTRVICGGLKALGIALLLLCLLEPLWLGRRVQPGANYFAVLVDNSQGLQVKDEGAAMSRAEELRDFLAARPSPWQEKLGETFQVRRYLFDSRLETLRDESELQFDGRASSLHSALAKLRERYRGQPLAGILLFSDGNATDQPAAEGAESGPPVYPVVIGKDEPIRDVGIHKLAVSQTSFEDAPVSVQVDLQVNGYAQAPVLAQLFELDHRSQPVTESLAAEAQAAAESGSELVTFRFQVRPARTGISFYRFQAVPLAEKEAWREPSLSTEATLANNQRILTVDRNRGPFRILYVAGRPNWEYKFLNRALLDGEREIQLVGLIRIAKREPKFDFRGRTGETSNPLFRGFQGEDEETERYDQPVVVRLNLRDQSELLGGFPKAAADLFPYHAVILDDVEAEFFTHDQMNLLHRFVAERGGGLLMLGGYESFREGQHEGTAIGRMLPVYLNRTPPAPPENPLQFDLTREGWLQPWLRLRSNEKEERKRLDDMPALRVLNSAAHIKPGASILATVRDRRGRQHPALVVQRYGRGRTAALTVGDLWRWGMQDAEAREDLNKSWRQLARWLVVDVPLRFELQAIPHPENPQTTVIETRGRTDEFQPMENARVEYRVHTVRRGTAPSAKTVAGDTLVPDKSGVPLSAEPALSELGLYTADYICRETGGYWASAVIRDSDGVEVGSPEVAWTSEPSADEFRSLAPNGVLLEEIARKSGGEMVSLEELDRFVTTLPVREAPVTQSWARPLWDHPLVFLLALACFAAEWGLRRYRGLA